MELHLWVFNPPASLPNLGIWIDYIQNIAVISPAPEASGHGDLATFSLLVRKVIFHRNWFVSPFQQPFDDLSLLG